jgi:multidrug resistance efflux pump
MNAVDTSARDEELDRLRAELAEWRRRAEIAEAVSAERLARAENAETALEAARSALGVGRPTGSQAASEAAPGTTEPTTGTAGEPVAPPPPRSLRERWRSYIESVN